MFCCWAPCPSIIPAKAPKDRRVRPVPRALQAWRVPPELRVNRAPTGGGGAIQITLDTLSTNAEGDAGRGFEVGEASIKAVENGVILVYAKSGDVWWPLPGIVAFTNDASNYSFAYAIQGVNLIIQLFQLDETPKKRQFQAVRVVIIPAAAGRLNAEIDYKDYEAVRKAFDLPE